MNCECIRAINDKLKGAGYKYQLDVATVFDSKMNASANLEIATHWIDRTKRGKKPPSVLCTFCPFCGQRVEAKGDVAA